METTAQQEIMAEAEAAPAVQRVPGRLMVALAAMVMSTPLLPGERRALVVVAAGAEADKEAGLRTRSYAPTGVSMAEEAAAHGLVPRAVVTAHPEFSS